MIMTLDIAKFITNSIRTQAKIQHLDINVKTVSTKKIPESVSVPITSDYGEQYLLDANYVAFFWGAITKDTISKLFNVVDKALGKSANKLTDKDFKKINIEIESTSNTKFDELSNDNIDDEDDSSDEEIEDTTSIQDDVSDEEESLNEDDEITKPIKTSYFFLKITTK
jgi:hypothetical protein